MASSTHFLRAPWALARKLIAPLSLIILLAFAMAVQAQPTFVTFDSGHVRPLALTPDGNTLLAVNTPDNRLEVFTVNPSYLVHTHSIPVGMEPVAVAARDNNEVWVVNHLSDSVSVIDLSATPPAVVRTLLVGDEPRDVVFAGTGGTDRAFITAARRGQHLDNVGHNAALSTPGEGRADVWVFNANNLGSALGGEPDAVLTFFSDTPRALAVTPDRSTVYVAAFYSGNQTTAIGETVIPDGFGANGAPGPDDNFEGDPAPEVGVIAKFDGTNWIDADGANRSNLVPFNLPDHDVFSINANTLANGSIVEYDHVGTILFNMVVNPVTGRVYVTNTELPNHIQFEGPGEHGNSTVQGHLSESRITVLNPGNGSVDPQHLNQHINYDLLHTDENATTSNTIDSYKPHSLATPLQPVVNGAGDTLYVAAFGSAKIGVFDVSDIEDANFETNFDPTFESTNYLTTGGGPSGMALDEANDRLYVMTRFSNQVEIINLLTSTVVDTYPLHNPEPQHVVDGRPFLYDAQLTSGNGEASCSSCHIFGDMDHLAWDLGNPDEHETSNVQPHQVFIPLGGNTANIFHPMKGPMTTQTLRGMATHGSLHWRGDRVDGFFTPNGAGACAEPTGAACSENLGFMNFIVAFEGLVGLQGPVNDPSSITAAQMQQFTDFALELMLPPNPIRPLDHSFSDDADDGLDLFGEPGNPARATDTISDCQGCHRMDPSQGFFGTGGGKTFENEPQFMKVAHMRNMYHKVGMFRVAGDQVRGFGFLHDGSVDTVETFLRAPVFGLNRRERRDLEQFSHEFPTDLAPIVGQQITLTSNNAANVGPRIDLMIARAGQNYNSLMLGGNVPECDVIVKGTIGGAQRGALRQPNGQFLTDDNQLVSDAVLRGLINSEGPGTYTCVPPGSGTRMGIDRDEDGNLDFLDNCPSAANSNQADADTDGIGDACEPDTDRDGILDDNDNCPLDSNVFQGDEDGDGIGNPCDPDYEAPPLPPGC
ncbi:MAG: thrombospondin type 3 repeat-containing protein [Halioglobus sp.]|nr:thrombospondin type 3 repeat-containing protein [Halioglobus sp.]